MLFMNIVNYCVCVNVHNRFWSSAKMMHFMKTSVDLRGCQAEWVNPLTTTIFFYFFCRLNSLPLELGNLLMSAILSIGSGLKSLAQSVSVLLMQFNPAHLSEGWHQAKYRQGWFSLSPNLPPILPRQLLWLWLSRAMNKKPSDLHPHRRGRQVACQVGEAFIAETGAFCRPPYILRLPCKRGIRGIGLSRSLRQNDGRVFLAVLAATL